MKDKFAYHLFDYKTNKVVAIPGWQNQQKSKFVNLAAASFDFHPAYITALDFDPEGRNIASFDEESCCVISKVGRKAIASLQISRQGKNGIVAFERDNSFDRMV